MNLPFFIHKIFRFLENYVLEFRVGGYLIAWYCHKIDFFLALILIWDLVEVYVSLTSISSLRYSSAYEHPRFTLSAHSYLPLTHYNIMLIIVIIQRSLTLVKGQKFPSKWTIVECGLYDYVGYYIFSKKEVVFWHISESLESNSDISQGLQ